MKQKYVEKNVTNFSKLTIPFLNKNFKNVCIHFPRLFISFTFPKLERLNTEFLFQRFFSLKLTPYRELQCKLYELHFSYNYQYRHLIRF